MNSLFKFCALILLLEGLSEVKAQDTTKSKVTHLTYSGYIETYYSYDFSKPISHQRPAFFYSYNRHNEVNLNLGFIKANYQNQKIKANLALMAGTYPQYNLANEPQALQNVFEANVGWKVSGKSNLWLELGIMPSHIGFESAIGKECWNLSRSILADNSPYYESGAKLSYTSNDEKYYLALLYLNGWQRIKRIEQNQTPAFGSQISIKPSDKTILNWSTYIGNEQVDTMQKWRFFNNIYGVLELTKNLGLILGFDLGIQQKRDSTLKLIKGMDKWFSPILILRYTLSAKTRLACRAEYYSDPRQVIIQTGTPNGFKTMGYSLNYDYCPFENAMMRIEARQLISKDKIFESTSNQNIYLTTSFAISF